MENFIIFIEITSAFFIIMDPLGNIPVFLYFLKPFDEKRQRRIILRESLIALTVSILALFVGDYLLDFLHISQSTLRVSGGLILFLIALPMIFPHLFNKPEAQNCQNIEPFIVPIAIPCIAGPSLLAMIMVYSQQEDKLALLPTRAKSPLIYQWRCKRLQKCRKHFFCFLIFEESIDSFLWKSTR